MSSEIVSVNVFTHQSSHKSLYILTTGQYYITISLCGTRCSWNTLVVIQFTKETMTCFHTSEYQFSVH